MARPIESTPPLNKRETVRFLKALQEQKPYVPPKFDLDKMRKIAVQLLQKNANR